MICLIQSVSYSYFQGFPLHLLPMKSPHPIRKPYGEMGNCVPASMEVIEVSDEDRHRHWEVERSLKKVRIQCSHISSFQCIYMYLLGLVLLNTNDPVFSDEPKNGLTAQGT